jgi:2,4'-dihydroxyacetophenone dioxygenase
VHRPEIVQHLKGAWGYKEYGWIARKGDFVYEPAGFIHTLYTAPGDEETIIFFIIDGALEFFDEKGKSLAIVDWKDALDMYHMYCKEKNIDIVDLTRFN